MYWGYSIVGFSPCFTHFYLFAHIFCSFPPHPLYFYVDFSHHGGGALDPQGCRVYIAFPPSFGPPRSEAATSDFVPFVGTPDNAGVT